MLDPVWPLSWPAFLPFHPHLLWLGRGCLKPCRPCPHPPPSHREGEQTERAGASSRGPLRLKMCHFHRVWGLLAVGGSTTLAVQRHRSSSGVARDFQRACREPAVRTYGFSNLSLGACLHGSQRCACSWSRVTDAK